MVIRRRISKKNRQHNDQMKREKGHNYDDLRNITQNTKDRATQKTEGEHRNHRNITEYLRMFTV